jgi:hypothetical protein
VCSLVSDPREPSHNYKGRELQRIISFFFFFSQSVLDSEHHLGLSESATAITTMGTRGLKVYQHNGLYLVRYYDWDSYPEGLGLEVLREIPRAGATDEEFQEWLTATRKVVEDRMRELEGVGEDDMQWQWVTDELPRPGGSLFTDWVYVLDLDSLVFHIDSFPVFRLDHPLWPTCLWS